MSKKLRFRGNFHKYHGKWAKTLLKSQRQHLYNIYWSLGRQFTWEKFLLVTCKILGLFANTVTADDKYFLLNSDSLLQHLQMQLSQKQKTVFQFIWHFGNLHSILNYLKKKMTVIAQVFLTLRSPKNVVR